MSLPTLDFTTLENAVADDAALRSTARLQPAGGPGAKVFPVTYEGGRYAVEDRRLPGDEGERVPCALLDSVQSQANRFEAALRRAWDEGAMEFPVVSADFSDKFPDIGKLTSLDAPHRVADGLFRECTYDGDNFRKSALGKKFIKSNTNYATPLYELSPNALVYGMWDSTSAGDQAGLGHKFARTISSEVVAFDIEQGKRASSRIDPTGIQKGVGEIYVTEDGTITFDADEAPDDAKAKKPSDVNLGNITPSFEDGDGNEHHGGVTMQYAKQTVVITLAGIRKLNFPPSAGGESHTQRDRAARTVVAAMGLAGTVLQRSDGFDLRSRCCLVPETRPTWEIVHPDGSTDKFQLDSHSVIELFDDAVAHAKGQGLLWEVFDYELEPRSELIELIRRSRGMVEDEEA